MSTFQPLYHSFSRSHLFPFVRTFFLLSKCEFLIGLFFSIKNSLRGFQPRWGQKTGNRIVCEFCTEHMTNYFVVIYSHIVHFWCCIFSQHWNHCVTVGYCFICVYERAMASGAAAVHWHLNCIYKYAVKCRVKCIQIAAHVYSTAGHFIQAKNHFPVKLNWFLGTNCF